MLTTDLPDWLIQTFSDLPYGTDPSVFGRLWSERRLRFDGLGQQEADTIDELSARLACAALSKQEQFLIVLPDNQPRRPALLFATGLLVQTLVRMAVSQTGGQVLYFGSNVGIRDHLSQTRIRNLTLASVFPQTRTVRQNFDQISPAHKIEIDKLRLPQVLCVYSPVDPVSVIQRNPAKSLSE
jgi:hypothetical protein